MTPQTQNWLGARLKAERQARGWTQREVAEAVAAAMGDQLTTDVATLVDYVKRWERGRAGVGARYRAALADAFGIPQGRLFDPPEAEDDPVQRRAFLSATAAMGLAITPLDPGASTRRRIGADLVDRLRRRTARLRQLDDVLGGIDTFRVYAAEVSATRRLLGRATYSEATGRGLLGVLAEQTQQAGWAALDSGRMAEAGALFRDSMTAASEAGSTALMGNSLALMSYQRVSAGRRGTVEADAACRVVSPQTPAAVRALLHERAAWAHAVAGPGHSGRVEESLDKARAAIAEADDPAPDWARWVDEVELQIMTGRCWTVLKRPDRAVPALEWALSRYDDSHARDKSLYLSWLTEAHLEARDIDEAARTLTRAIELGADVASARPRQRVRAVIGRLRPHAFEPRVAEAIDRARSLSLV
ncbi:helix-turn-helix domain-containing protein [Actinomadura sediminis]|uniref:Helix-turn-helix domain-containing protein n=1 Tax=Actinomadura sediminis TaxID=1038904 RepID=A0ABW3EPF7_9ACTN